MKLFQLKNTVKEVIRENFKQSILEASYDFGKKQYTDRNMTPTDILDLAMAYVNTPITKISGKSIGSMVVTANDLARLTGTTQMDVTRRGKPALIVVLLKNGLLDKSEYMKLYRDLISRQSQFIEKYLKNADPASRMVGGAAARQAYKDMKGEFEESVNEAKYPTDLKIGSVIKGQGFTRLKGIDGGKYYKIVDMDDTTATLTRTDPSGKVSSPTKVRHKLDSIEAGIKTAKRGDENGIIVIKESVNEAFRDGTASHFNSELTKWAKKYNVKFDYKFKEKGKKSIPYFIIYVDSDDMNNTQTIELNKLTRSFHVDYRPIGKTLVVESINEAFTKGKTYGGTKCEGGCFIGKQGLMKIIKISKESPKNVFLFRDDNYSGLQPHFIKDGVIAKASSIGNPSYDLERNKVRNLNIGKDVILLVRLVD